MASLAEKGSAPLSPWRVVLFTAGLLLALLVLVARLVQLQIGEHATYLQRARANQIRLIPVPPPRGRLYDRTGRVLVRSRPSFVVEIVPSEISDSHAAIAELAQLLALPEDTLWKRVLHHRGINYHNFDEVVTGEPFGPVIVANDLTHAQLSRLAEERIDGVQVSVEPVRDYPYRSLGSHIFGYVGAITEDEFKRLRSKGYTANDVVGKDGLEAAYDDALRGIPGGERIEVDAQGQIVRRVAPQVAIPGHGLILTLDWHLQQIVERALENGIATVAQTRGRTISGAVVVLDPYSGAVLALASNPNFDPNDFARGIGERRYARYLNDPLEPLYDRAIAAATATGSTFKMITGSAALSAGVVQRDEIVYDSGYWNCHGQLFRDIAAGGLGATTFVTALAASSDGYFYQMADRLGYDRLSSYARKFGIAARSGIDLPGEYPGNWPTDAWTRKVYGVPLEPSDVCQLGIGQGAMQATPLQMANVVATVVNGGTLYRPHLLLAIRDASGKVERARGEVIRHVAVSAAALAAVREGMSRVTDPGGTAYGLAIPGLPFGGKTGTVETAGGNGPNTTWFVAYAPTEHPKIALAVFMERTGGYGAEVAAPVARQIILEYLGHASR